MVNLCDILEEVKLQHRKAEQWLPGASDGQ